VVDKSQYIKAGFTGAVGAFGGLVAEQLGGWTSDMKALITCMAIDFILGCMIAFVLKKSPKTDSGAGGSQAMWIGLCRKGVTLLIVFVAYQLDLVLKVNYIRTAVIISFIANEVVSIVENSAIIGVPMPAALKKAIDILKSKEKED
jgi:toxin secretion/phage lysis holin